MLVFGLLMIAWALTRPLSEELGEGEGPASARRRSASTPPRSPHTSAAGGPGRRGAPRRAGDARPE